MINKDSLKAKANNISKELDISQNTVYNRFFFDAFLSRLAVSHYKDRFILKGGLYLSSILGIDTRSTMDIDFYLKKLSMEKETIVKALEEIASIDINDGIIFKVIGIEDIREDDLYGGFQVKVLARLDNVKYQFNIDIATGDPIVPSERNYKYKCLVTDEILPLKAYSVESVVAEKVETVLSRGITNSRSKDYYDLYILRKTQIDNLNRDMLKKAYEDVCAYRHFSMSYDDAFNLVDEISVNAQINTRWINYCKNVGYIDDLSFQDVMTAIKDWLDILL